MSDSDALPSFRDVQAAADRLAGRVLRTELIELRDVAVPASVRLFLKLENRQHARCFKPRGALNCALRAAERGAVSGLITFSSGNHGQAVALAAGVLGVPSLVVSPEDVRPGKRAAMEARGARVVTCGLTSAERMARAMQLADENGYLLIPPYDHFDVVAGQGTVGLEVAEQAPDMDVACVPVGGGGLISGVATALAAVQPAVRVVGVEPADADDARRSLRTGRLASNEAPSRSACDGLRNTKLGDLPWRVIQHHVSDVVTVTDVEVERATALLEAHGLGPVEPSGAASTAAVLTGKVGSAGATVVAIVSGGNAS